MEEINPTIRQKFEALGAKFYCTDKLFIEKLEGIKAFIFDWDGVFNNGIKANNEGSPFSEVDSMGINMLRFSFYLRFGFIPHIFVITGENNIPALNLSKREHFSGVYLKAKQKSLALEHLAKNLKIEGNEVAFVYDDILDLGLASEVNLRFFINRDANPLLNNYVERHKLMEYQTESTGANNAVREICELCIGSLGNYDEVVIERVRYSANYQEYLKTRDAIETRYFKFDNSQIIKIEHP